MVDVRWLAVVAQEVEDVRWLKDRPIDASISLVRVKVKEQVEMGWPKAHVVKNWKSGRVEDEDVRCSPQVGRVEDEKVEDPTWIIDDRQALATPLHNRFRNRFCLSNSQSDSLSISLMDIGCPINDDFNITIEV
ncbi:hypothetical protein E3N88_11949 [Mikania micrantha]|uniref:Uncharacterized protein n=1 Tax=Mikania micrantha TaxID=192012 RepID=A0A5N6P451_9ASTR|nr:hypothetical protein E3N88_11949 [Mikania micrantha]